MATRYPVITAQITSPHPCWEVFATIEGTLSLIGYLTQVKDLFEVLEVIAPYDLAYTSTLDAAVRHFRVLVHAPLRLIPMFPAPDFPLDLSVDQGPNS